MIFFQVWILHNSEPPYNIYIDLKRFNNIFNWTSWYRKDADIYSPYGGFVKKNKTIEVLNQSVTNGNDTQVNDYETKFDCHFIECLN